MSDLRPPRLPISVEVAYRTAGAFLVSYSINLSKGGIFIETATPLARGARVSLRFAVPDIGPLEAEGVVAWIRDSSADGLPVGMGIQFDTLDARYGDRIDALVRSFSGLTVLVVAAVSDRLALIGRYIRAIVACEIVEATGTELAEVALEGRPDLVVVDLDLKPDMGLRCIRAASARDKATPIILLSGNPTIRQAGKEAGAYEALATPPSYHELQAAVIRTLSRPTAVK